MSQIVLYIIINEHEYIQQNNWVCEFTIILLLYSYNRIDDWVYS